MTHPLVEYYQAAQKALKEARQILMGAGDEEAFPAQLHEEFSSLFLRMRRPEVRVMVSGPLKAGKSTLLNVLAGNPHISQISQLPAYPCFVEVHDLERNSDGTPREEPGSLFYRRGGELDRELSQQEGIAFLDELLDQFIEAGGQGRIEYERVVQKTALPRQEGEAGLVLIDSPGLFFSHRVDQILFPSVPETASEALEESKSARDLYLESDVVLFVIRPEQLFFQSVADYLRAFVQQTKMRIFILVNASTHSKTQIGDQIVDFNQVEEQSEIRRYFLRHIADQGLQDEIEKEGRISLHFADLLDAATAHFTNQGDAEAFSETPSGQVISRIRNYIFGQDLARLKIENLSASVSQVLHRAAQGLEDLRLNRLELVEEARQSHSDLQQRIDELEIRLERLSKDRDESVSQVQMLRERMAVTRQFLEHRNLPEDSPDPVLNEFLALQHSSPLPDWIADRLEGLAQEAARQIVEQIYQRWKAKEYGPRTLRKLAEVLWESKLEGDSLSLRAYSQQAVSDCFREIVSQVGETLRSVQLREAFSKVDPAGLEVQSANPVLSLPQIPLLDFGSRWTLRWNAWKSGFRLVPKTLWGEDGRRVIEAPDEERILLQKRKNLLRQIWGPPWALGECFSSAHLQSVARRILIAKMCRIWGVRITDDLAFREDELDFLSGRMEEVEQHIQLLRPRLGELESQLEKTLRFDEDLQERRDCMAGLTEELRVLEPTAAPQAEEDEIQPEVPLAAESAEPEPEPEPPILEEPREELDG